MGRLVQGRIVFPRIPIADPQGRNPKPGRPFIVVSPAESIAAGDELLLVAISGEVFGATHEVPLTWANPGVRCTTGLTKPSVAVCNWTARVPQSEVDIGRGFIPPLELEQILLKVANA